MNKAFKSFMEEIARSRNYFHRHDVLRSLISFATAVRGMLSSQIMGREKLEAAGAIREMVGLLNRTEEVKTHGKGGLRFAKGKEKALLMQLLHVVKHLQAAMAEESREEARKRKLQIDRLLIRGQKHLDHKKVGEAEEAFQEAVSLYVDEHKLFYFIAAKLLAADQPRPALKYLQRAMEADPDEEQNYRAMAEAWEKIGDMEKAEQFLLQSLEKYGDDFRTWVQLGNVQLRAGRLKDSLESVKQAREQDPTHPDAKKLLQKIKKAAAKKQQKAKAAKTL